MTYYVEKYLNDAAYMDGDMSSCKKFDDEGTARKYFETMGTKYKKGFLILSEENEDGFSDIIEEIALEAK